MNAIAHIAIRFGSGLLEVLETHVLTSKDCAAIMFQEQRMKRWSGCRKIYKNMVYASDTV
jgi:hypothetical protein